MKKSLMPGLLLALVLGCSTPIPDVASHYDAVSGLRTDLLSDNLLTTEGPPRELVWLNASRLFKNSRDADYYLEVSYMATQEVGALEIQPGDSLTIVTDSKELVFSGTGSGGMRKVTKEFVRESAIYQATRIQLQEIALAKQVKVRVKGRNGLIEREFKEENFNRYREFVTRFAL